MVFSESGKIVAKWIVWLEAQYQHVLLDTWCVMPNHVHMIVVLVDDELGVSRNAPTKRKPLGRLVGAFKTVSSKEINDLQGVSEVKFWQRDFYEHIIRNERESQEKPIMTPHPVSHFSFQRLS